MCLVFQSDGMDLDKNHSDLDNMSSSDTGNRKLGSSANEYDTCTTATISSPEPEEYTYEGAIQNYKSRIISSKLSSDALVTTKVNGIKEKSPESNGVRRPSIGSKIENKLSSFESKRESSVENLIDKKPLPKVDILKKREVFEKESSPESNGLSNKSAVKSDFTNSKSIKERLSHLEKLSEDTNNTNNKVNSKIAVNTTTLKDRLNSLEKTVDSVDKNNFNKSNGDLNSSISIKDRLSSLNTKNTSEKLIVNTVSTPVVTTTLKDRLANLDSVRSKESNLNASPEREVVEKFKFNSVSNVSDSKPQNDHQMNGQTNVNGLVDIKKFHRSLDSLDTDDNLLSEKFERIQSLEDLCGEICTGTDTDREDSGIHTGDVSCAVSQDDEPCDNFSVALLKTSTNSQDTVICNEEMRSIEEATSLQEEEPITQEDSVCFDRDEEDTVKSLDPDNSVSLHDNSISSESEHIVFEGKMLIHVNFNEINSLVNNNINNSKGIDSTNDTNNTFRDESKAMLSCDKPVVTVSEMCTNPTYSSLSTRFKPPPLSNSNKIYPDHSPSPNKFAQSPPILESTGRWTILQINNKSTPASPVVDTTPNYPINVIKEKFESNCHEEKFVFQANGNFICDISKAISADSFNCNKNILNDVN